MHGHSFYFLARRGVCDLLAIGMYRSDVRSSYSTTGVGGITPGGRGGAEMNKMKPMLFLKLKLPCLQYWNLGCINEIWLNSLFNHHYKLKGVTFKLVYEFLLELHALSGGWDHKPSRYCKLTRMQSSSQRTYLFTLHINFQDLWFVEKSNKIDHVFSRLHVWSCQRSLFKFYKTKIFQ